MCTTKLTSWGLKATTLQAWQRIASTSKYSRVLIKEIITFRRVEFYFCCVLFGFFLHFGLFVLCAQLKSDCFLLRMITRGIVRQSIFVAWKSYKVSHFSPGRSTFRRVIYCLCQWTFICAGFYSRKGYIRILVMWYVHPYVRDSTSSTTPYLMVGNVQEMELFAGSNSLFDG